MRRVVLVTRPEPGLGETMRAVAARGFEPLAAPLLHMETLSPSIPRRVQAVLLTSGQAVAPLAAQAPWLRDVPLLAVGDATAERARAEGFEQVRSADGDAARLAALAGSVLKPDGGSLLLGCGCGQAIALAAALRGAGFSVARRCVYRSGPVSALAQPACDALGEDRVRAALFFSAETARVFRRVLPGPLAARLRGVRALAIGAAAGLVLSELDWDGVLVAPAPNAAAVLSLLDPDPHPVASRPARRTTT